MTSHYNAKASPDVFFDGGYVVKIGGGSGNYASYNQALIQCGNRAVSDINIDLTSQWLGNSTLQISVTVTNNDPAQYGGWVYVSVTEVESSLGWKDSAQDPYTFAFLDWAIYENTLDLDPSGGTYEKTLVWAGPEHSSGYGQTYDNLTRSNIMVIAGVYNDEWHQGYSYPPSTYPFDAYYVDEAAGVIPERENPLLADTYTLSETGGTVNLYLNTGSGNADRNYLILGGVTGSSPGIPLPGGLKTLPVNWDPFTDIVVALLNTPVFKDFMSTLDENGWATAQINSGAIPPGFVGVEMTYAYALSDPYNYVSGPIVVEIVQ